MPEDDRDLLVVVRFSPFGEEALNRSVAKQVIGDELKRRTPRHGVSVFADHVGEGEEFSEAVDRICERVRLHASGDKVAVTTGKFLRDAGYCLYETVPPELHYLIGGDDLHLPPPPLAGLADIFTRDRRKNVAFEKGLGR